MPQGLSRDEKRKTLDSFLEPAEPSLPLVDRSTADHWATCPWAAKEIEQGRGGPVGFAAESGTAIHDCLSAVTASWIASHGAMSLTDLREELVYELQRTRPDLQPEAIKGCQPSVWQWAKFLEAIHPENVLRFDGGKGERSGQLACDMPDLGARITGEVDLLYASPSPEVIEHVDYKTGHQPYWVSDVADSFQMQWYAVLILENYPDVKAVRTRIWCTRLNRTTHAVYFNRDKLHQYTVRIRSALRFRHEYGSAEHPPCWPTSEKCSQCQVAARCPVASYPISAEPVDVLRDLIAVEARADALRQRLVAHVDATGKDVQCGGVCFGRNKPKAERKAPATLYDLE